MFFFLFSRRYPWLRPVVGLAAFVLGLIVHWDVLIAAGAALTVIGVIMAVSRARRGGPIGSKGQGRSLR